MTQPVFLVEDPPITDNMHLNAWLKKLVESNRAMWNQLYDLGQNLELDSDGKIRVVRFRRARFDFTDERNVPFVGEV